MSNDHHHHHSPFGDINGDGREDRMDDMMGLWLMGGYLRAQREKRELQEELERERRRRQDRVRDEIFEGFAADREKYRSASLNVPPARPAAPASAPQPGPDSTSGVGSDREAGTRPTSGSAGVPIWLFLLVVSGLLLLVIGLAVGGH